MTVWVQPPPEVPAEVPPRFAVDGARVIPVGELPAVEDDPSRYVVVGSGKTATDAIVWLTDTEVGRGIDPGRYLRATGLICHPGGVPTIYNPAYELVPRHEQ